MSPDDVTRPADLATASTGELLAGWHGHISALIDASHNVGAPKSGGRLRGHALDALAVGQALADQITSTRWVTAVDALTYGATVAQVAAAMGLDVDEVEAGLGSWADGQHRHGGMTAAGRDEVLALLAGGAR